MRSRAPHCAAEVVGSARGAPPSRSRPAPGPAAPWTHAATRWSHCSCSGDLSLPPPQKVRLAAAAACRLLRPARLRLAPRAVPCTLADSRSPQQPHDAAHADTCRPSLAPQVVVEYAPAAVDAFIALADAVEAEFEGILVDGVEVRGVARRGAGGGEGAAAAARADRAAAAAAEAQAGRRLRACASARRPAGVASRLAPMPGTHASRSQAPGTAAAQLAAGCCSRTPSCALITRRPHGHPPRPRRSPTAPAPSTSSWRMGAACSARGSRAAPAPSRPRRRSTRTCLSGCAAQGCRPPPRERAAAAHARTRARKLCCPAGSQLACPEASPRRPSRRCLQRFSPSTFCPSAPDCQMLHLPPNLYP